MSGFEAWTPWTAGRVIPPFSLFSFPEGLLLFKPVQLSKVSKKYKYTNHLPVGSTANTPT